MPSITPLFLDNLQEDYRNYSCFIETGTYNGGTIFAVEPYFEKLHTVEFSELYYNRTKSRYLGNKINFILGDSSIVFETLLRTIPDKSIFFLDGHWSCEDTGRSNKDCPLEEEIKHINELFVNEAIIIIDDYRLFGLDKSNIGMEDWSQINKEKLLNILKDRIKCVYHLPSELAIDDRLIVHIHAKR